MQGCISELIHDPENGLVTAVRVADEEIALTGSGCEIGNWLGFFSQQRLDGIACHIESKRIDPHGCRFRIRLPRARFELTLHDRLEQGVWRRDHHATALEPSWIGDLVVRAAYPADAWQVDGCRHRGRNSYLQRPRRTLILHNGARRMVSTCIGVAAPRGLTLMGYYRDCPKLGWVLHHRLLVARKRAEHVVWRFRRHAAPGPAFPGLTQCFWGFSERVLSQLPGPTPTVQSMGVIKLSAGETVSMSVAVDFAAAR